MAIDIEKRRSDTAIGDLGMGAIQPAGSSDINELQYVINKNFVNYITDSITVGTPKIAIKGISKLAQGTTDILGFKYLLKVPAGDCYYGGSNTSVKIDLDNYTGNAAYDLYAFVRLVQANLNTQLYKDGIRTNDVQTSIIEEVVQNNIGNPHFTDDLTGDMVEVSDRTVLEFTFVAVLSGSAAPALDNWTYRCLATTIQLDGSGVPKTYNNKEEVFVQPLINIYNASGEVTSSYKQTNISIAPKSLNLTPKEGEVIFTY